MDIRLALLHLHNITICIMSASTSIGQRFTQLIQQLGMSKNAFAQSLDKTATVIQHLVDERNKPGYDLICKVFEVYPNVSKDWLLLGDGPMLRPEATVEPPAASPAATPVAVPLFPSASPVPADAIVPPASAPVSVAANAASTPAGNASQVVEAVAPAPLAAAQTQPELVTPTPTPNPQPAPIVAAVPDASYITAALQTQYLQHQLALAEQRNQHLLEQQKLMQQMLNLLQRNTE
jgi:hypothetical protein